MGRGRAKAKQTKVARELKYSSGNTDLTALQRELAGSAGYGTTGAVRAVPAVAADADDAADDDPYVDVYADDTDDTDDGPRHAAR